MAKDCVCSLQNPGKIYLSYINSFILTTGLSNALLPHRIVVRALGDSGRLSFLVFYLPVLNILHKLSWAAQHIFVRMDWAGCSNRGRSYLLHRTYGNHWFRSNL